MRFKLSDAGHVGEGIGIPAIAAIHIVFSYLKLRAGEGSIAWIGPVKIHVRIHANGKHRT